MIKVFVPVYNEGDRIKENLKYIYLSLKQHLVDSFKLYLVDDGSVDNTVNVLNILSGEELYFHYLFYPGPSRRENLAKAMAEYGIAGDVIVMLDSDRSTNEEIIPRMIGHLNTWDVVVGSRYLPGSKIKRSFGRYIISRFYNFIIQFLFDSPVADHECGLKVFRYDAFARIVKDMGYNLDRKFFWDAEFLIRAHYKGLKIIEVPVTWTEGERTSQSFLKDWPMIIYILKMTYRI
jgi:dolichol-phosphate mannosyltransferase